MGSVGREDWWRWYGVDSDLATEGRGAEAPCRHKNGKMRRVVIRPR